MNDDDVRLGSFINILTQFYTQYGDIPVGITVDGACTSNFTITVVENGIDTFVDICEV